MELEESSLSGSNNNAIVCSPRALINSIREKKKSQLKKSPKGSKKEDLIQFESEELIPTDGIEVNVTASEDEEYADETGDRSDLDTDSDISDLNWI